MFTPQQADVYYVELSVDKLESEYVSTILRTLIATGSIEPCSARREPGCQVSTPSTAYVSRRSCHVRLPPLSPSPT
jgi:hypothetical protein